MIAVDTVVVIPVVDGSDGRVRLHVERGALDHARHLAGVEYRLVLVGADVLSAHEVAVDAVHVAVLEGREAHRFLDAVRPLALLSDWERHRLDVPAVAPRYARAQRVRFEDYGLQVKLLLQQRARYVHSHHAGADDDSVGWLSRPRRLIAGIWAGLGSCAVAADLQPHPALCSVQMRSYTMNASLRKY